MKPEPDYKEICLMMQSLAEGVPYTMTNLANASALLNEKLSGINWAGFYTMKNGQLVLGPFQGKVACTIIPLGQREQQRNRGPHAQKRRGLRSPGHRQPPLRPLH